MNLQITVLISKFVSTVRIVPQRVAREYTQEDNEMEQRHGCGELVMLLAEKTSIPGSLIAHPYWREEIERLENEPSAELKAQQISLLPVTKKNKNG